MIVLIFLLLLLLGTLIALVFSFNALFHTLRTGLPYVTTPDWAIDWMKQNLKLGAQDSVYELGCGDARVIVGLAKQFPETKFIGIEIQWWPWLLAKWRARKIPNVKIIRGDIYQHNLQPATVIYGFYITAFTQRLADFLRPSLQAGTVVLSYGFRLPGWTTKTEISQPGHTGGSRLLLYRAG